MELKSYEELKGESIFEIEEYIRSLPWSEETSDETRTLVAGNLRALYYKLSVVVREQLPKFYVWRRRKPGPEDGLVKFRVGSHLYSSNVQSATKYPADMAATLCVENVNLFAIPVGRVELLQHRVVRYGLMEMELTQVAGTYLESDLPPVDRTKVREVSQSGVEGPVSDDHRELKPDGQQRGYVVLSQEERDQGFVRPVRDRYIHIECGTVTTMNKSIAETYARDPNFYSGTFCYKCREHFPLDQFVWVDEEGEQVGS